MPTAIADYALLGDLRTAALVGKDGSIDWLCVPRFDSGACFAALLGNRHNGRFRIAPAEESGISRHRRYRDGSLILESEFQTPTGTVRLLDFMPPEETRPKVVRIVEGVSGQVRMQMELIMRFDYGREVPWVRRVGGVLCGVAGPDALSLFTPVPTHGHNFTTVAEFDVSAGQRVPFVLSWFRSHEARPPEPDAEALLANAERWWTAWSSQCSYRGPWEDAVRGSLVTLKGLIYAPTGGIVAAPTTSLPEWPGSERNWDYRYCWLRDATFTLYALMLSGYREEACAWRDWLLRAVAGSPSQMQIMYGVAGERRLPELTLPWLPGHLASSPVRIGNDAVWQKQLDVYGELMDALYFARKSGVDADAFAWRVQCALLDFLETGWEQPDTGLWEVRGDAQHFTHSKVMAWVAFDRAVKTAERFGMDGPIPCWKFLCAKIHDEVCRRAFDREKNAFTQAFGSRTLDASVLMIPLVGFLPAHDPRMQGTVRAIERELLQDGLVLRYRSDETLDGLPPGEGVFLPCSFWLADNYAMLGRAAEARALFERLLTLRNDVGLLAEEYDPVERKQLGNFPQAFSHVGLINTAYNLRPRQLGPAAQRAEQNSDTMLQ